MILLTAIVDIDPAQRDAFIEAALKVMAITRGEQGCDFFTLSADLEDDGRFHISERWASEDDLNAHNERPHTAEFRATVGGYVKSADFMRWDGATGTKRQ